VSETVDELDGVTVGADAPVFSPPATEADFAGLTALGFTLPEVQAEHADHDVRLQRSMPGRVARVRGQWGGFGLKGSTQTRKFRVMAAEESKDKDLLGTVIDLVVSAVFDYLLKQAQQKRVEVTELMIKEVGGAFELIDFATKWKMTVDMTTVWDDTIAVYVGQSSFGPFRPGAEKSMRREIEVQGPKAGEQAPVRVSMWNTAGKVIEIIGNWSIDVSFKISMNGEVIGEARRNGYEGRGAQWTYGPYYYGLEKP
jgi:hypothetical protein